MRLCVWLSEQAEFLFRPSPSPAQSRPKRSAAAPGLTLRGRSSKPSPKRQFSKRRKTLLTAPFRLGRAQSFSLDRGATFPAFPNHIRKIPIIHLFAGYTETRPDNKTLRKNGRQFLSPKIARPPYPSRENHGSFSPERPVIFKANPRPRFPTSKNVNRRPHSGRGGNTRTLPVIRPCRRPRGESWERCPPDCCAPAPEYTTAHGRYPLRAAEPAACSRRCACGTSASV